MLHFSCLEIIHSHHSYCVLIEESLSSKYKGLAWEEDVVDGAAKEHQLNKCLLDHFRVLAANNQDTDEVLNDSV